MIRFVSVALFLLLFECFGITLISLCGGERVPVPSQLTRRARSYPGHFVPYRPSWYCILLLLSSSIGSRLFVDEIIFGPVCSKIYCQKSSFVKRVITILVLLVSFVLVEGIVRFVPSSSLYLLWLYFFDQKIEASICRTSRILLVSLVESYCMELCCSGDDDDDDDDDTLALVSGCVILQGKSSRRNACLLNESS